MTPIIPGDAGELFGSFARHLRALGRSTRTIESYEKAVARLVAFTKIDRIDKLTPDDMRRRLEHEQGRPRPDRLAFAIGRRGRSCGGW